MAQKLVIHTIKHEIMPQKLIIHAMKRKENVTQKLIIHAIKQKEKNGPEIDHPYYKT